MKNAFRTLVLGSLLTAGLGFAQQESVSVDEALVMTGLHGDAFEILSSELALEKSNSDQVLQFAQLMIDDHTASSGRLQEIAQGMGLEAEFAASPAQGLMLARLQQLEGDRFDVEYLAQQRMAHKAALVNYSIGAELASDEDLATFSAETAAAITEHLRLLEDLMNNMSITDPYEGFLDTPMEQMDMHGQTDSDQPQEEQQPDPNQTEEQPQEEQPEDDAGN